MAKSSDDIKELQRCINRLILLDGKLLWLGGAPYLVLYKAILDPEPLLSLTEGEVSEAEIQAALQQAFLLVKEPRQMTAQWLASAQHDLKILEDSPKLFSLAKEAPRLFKGINLDRAWLSQRRQQ